MKKLDNLIKALTILIIIGIVCGVLYLIIGGVKLNNLKNDKKAEINEEVEVGKIDKKKMEKEKKEKLEREKREEELREKEEKEEEEEKRKEDEINSKPGKNVINSGEEYSVGVKKVNEMMEGKKNGKKEVFLTFDDGPSENTTEILEILNKYDVHGTFFVLGSNLKGVNQNYLKDIYNSGNAIGNHTYSHEYKKIYPNNKVNVKTFMNEVEKTNKISRDILGEEFNTSVVRMPGGYVSRKYHKDTNLGELNKAFEKEKIVSIDWNVDSADSSGIGVPSERIVSSTIKGIGNLEDVVVLMHDTESKGTTVQALPKIIEYFQKNGYDFKVISN